MSESKFPLEVMHRGVRFKLAGTKETMRLLFTMVRDGVCTVDEAMLCLVYDDKSTPDHEPQTPQA